MDVYSCARRYLSPYKEKGFEIVPELCPYCSGGSHGDKYTFALNVDNLTFNCMRGSCGVTGTFNQLLRYLGEKPTRGDYQIHKPKPKNYKKPVPINNALSQKAIEYLAKRKISKETLVAMRVTENDGKICFNYYDDKNELVFRKYRSIGKEPQWIREKDTMPILYGMWRIDTTKPVVCVEGESDQLAVVESGINNVVSVPSGAKDFSWIENCWDWLQQIDEFILFGDTDEPGREMTEKLIVKLGEDRCRVGDNKYKDANELLYREGKDAVRNAIESARRVPKAGVVNVAEIKRKRGEVYGIPTGFKSLDRKLEDTQLGELTIWTGRSGDGKSTILSQVILEALDFGVSVFVYSGELTAQTFQEWINKQAAGEENLESYKNRYGDVKYEVKLEVENKIKNWYKDRLFLYDNTVVDKDIPNSGVLDLCKYTSKRYDCKVYVIDNLMTVGYDSSTERDYYLAQAKFVRSLKEFAKTHNVHVHLVIHPKKTEGELDKNSVSGRADNTNIADNVIAIEKNTGDGDYDATLKLIKNRRTGQMVRLILKFDEKSKRFYQLDSKGEYTLRTPYNWLKYPKWVEDAEKLSKKENTTLFS